MAITEDTANQPATASTTGAWTGAGLASGAFSPGAGSLIVVGVVGNALTNTTPTSTVSDSAGGTWKLLGRMNNSNTVAFLLEVWCRWCPTAPGSITVKTVGDANTTTGGQLTVRTLLGSQASQNGAVGSQFRAAAGAMSCSVAAGFGNRIYGVAQNWTTNAAFTALANTTVITATSDAVGGDEYESFKSAADTAGTATYGFSTSTQQGGILAVEILAAYRTPPPTVMSQATMARASTR